MPQALGEDGHRVERPQLPPLGHLWVIIWLGVVNCLRKWC